MINKNQHYTLNILKKAGIISMGVLMSLSVASVGNVGSNLAQAHAKKIASYDISQWQGYITDHQAKKLKHEVSFVILRAQNGGNQTDSKIHHNIKLMNKYHIPYGVYSFSLYSTKHQAKAEAKMLYHRAPHARFYINDAEVNYAHGRMNPATKTWAKEIHHLTDRPAILYSYLGFMMHFNKHTRKSYNGIWLADYSSKAPLTNFHYDLWQFTDNHYSRALKRRLDASKFPKHAKPLTFWLGSNKQSTTNTHPAKKVNLTPASKNTIHKIRANSNHNQQVKKVHHHKHHIIKKHKLNKKLHINNDNHVNKKHHPVIETVDQLPTNHHIEDERNPRHIVLSNDSDYNFFRVNTKNGINLYNLGGNKIKHIKHGEYVHVKRIASSSNRSYSVGSYHGKPVLFTSAFNKLARSDK